MITLFAGRIYKNGALDYCSEFFPTRDQAIAACLKARPSADRVMTSEVRFNEQLRQMVPTHYGIQWTDCRQKPAQKIEPVMVMK